MAKKFDFDGQVSNNDTSISNVPVVDTNIINEETPNLSQNGINGLSQAETNDPNSIVVTIADQQVPIVVLFGPASCGKTMTLIRLTRFLNKYGYKVSPIPHFRPSADTHYAKMCNEYNSLVNSNNAAQGNALISFMLVEVLDKCGRRICQILEAPGEFYYNPQMPNNPFPAYINTIINSNNRKIWLYMVEPNWKDQGDRSGYVNRIRQLKTMMRPQDRAIFLYNKVDNSNFVICPGKVNISGVKYDIANMYPGIFTPFTNLNPITKFFKPFLCELVPFSNGSFTKAVKADGTQYLTFQQGVDEYPQFLWNTIMKKIRG